MSLSHRRTIKLSISGAFCPTAPSPYFGCLELRLYCIIRESWRLSKMLSIRDLKWSSLGVTVMQGISKLFYGHLLIFSYFKLCLLTKLSCLSISASLKYLKKTLSLRRSEKNECFPPERFLEETLRSFRCNNNNFALIKERPHGVQSDICYCCQLLVTWECQSG